MIQRFLQFAEEFGNEEAASNDYDIIDSDEQAVVSHFRSLPQRIRDAVFSTDQNADHDLLEAEIERMMKMFYLEMRVKGCLNELKDDYFV